MQPDEPGKPTSPNTNSAAAQPRARATDAELALNCVAAARAQLKETIAFLQGVPRAGVLGMDGLARTLGRLDAAQQNLTAAWMRLPENKQAAKG